MQIFRGPLIAYGNNLGSVMWPISALGPADLLTGALGQQWQQALQVANGIINGAIADSTNGATFYYDISKGNPPPGWFTYEIRTQQLTFYGTNGTLIFLGPPPSPVPPSH